MAHSAKAKAAGVSASSFLDLKAELAKKENEFTRKMPSDKKNGKGTIWARTNKGVAARAARDVAALAADRHTADSARAALERKAKIYDKLRKGKSGGLTEAQIEALLVDFDAKEEDECSSDSDHMDESATVPKVDDEDDPIVEYEDEFGRIRTARKSEVPRNLLPQTKDEEEDDDDPFVVRNPVNHFPVFEQSAERMAALEKAAEEAEKPLESHYDASRENRAKGAAFYAFSADEEKRQREMDELRKAREETEKMRKEMGAVDVRPGQSEGQAAAQRESGKNAHTRTMAKRKRDIEERRKLLEAKRKRKGMRAEENKGDTTNDGSQGEEKADPFASIEAQEVEKKQKNRSRWDQKSKSKSSRTSPKASVSAADDFLAQLEQDLISKAT